MSIYQHFRPEEREFIDQVINWKEYVEQNYAPKLTDFLDPREQQILKTVIGKHPDVKWELFGGASGTERKRAFLFPAYLAVNEEDFQLKLFGIEYPSKFVNIEHRQVLGSLMSLGLKRGKFGDILIDGDTVQFFAVSEIADYIRLQLESIGRASIRLTELSLENAVTIDDEWNEMSTTVSSLRLDTVLSGIFNLSRQKSQLLIQHGQVKVNWTAIENTAFECGEGDVLSARGYGRAKIITVEGKTKKDKYRVIAGRKK
ncbi:MULTISPECIES: RNA-binding protein [Mesobacillus]|uniref:RNA-binding protein S4 n=2 Tax=Mesobacillus TaxID=2675231 RepID=A0A0D6Z533_9BACI|nr:MULTISPECIES: RNA-binding protein [Mesobacillus]KIY20692.1 RNA-binding protein S4 [Mesobacillus subterraneus]MDQ0412581.1 RNA-binding protein YlmH [Mesobacillus stamsii]